MAQGFPVIQKGPGSFSVEGFFRDGPDQGRRLGDDGVGRRPVVSARVVVVLDDTCLSDRTVELLVAEGVDVLAWPSAMMALDALEASAKIDLLVTCPQSAAGAPNGIALARMACMKRPGVKVLFVGTMEFAYLAEGLGSFVSIPITAEAVTDHVIQMLTAD